MNEKKKKNLVNLILIILIIALIPVIVSSIKKISNNLNKKATYKEAYLTTLSSEADLSDFQSLFNETNRTSVVEEMKDSVVKEKVADYFKETIINSGVSNETEANQYVDFVMDTFEGWLKNSDGTEVEEFLNLEVVQEVLGGTQLDLDSLSSIDYSSLFK